MKATSPMPQVPLEMELQRADAPAEARVPRRLLNAALRVIVLAALLLLLFTALDARATFDALRRVDAGLALAAIAVVQAQFLLSALRWRFTAARLGLRLPYAKALGEYYLAGFLNQTLPGGVMGDAARAYRNRAVDEDGNPGWRASVRSVVLERAAGQIAFFAVAIAGLAVWPFALPSSAPEDVETLIAAPALVVLGLGVVCALAAARAPRAVRSAFAELGPDIARVFVRRGAWLFQAIASLAIVGGYVAAFVLCAAALGVAIPPIGWFTVIPMVLLAMALPISVGGWGLREGAAVALFPLVGVDASSALAVAILYGIVNLIGALPGLPLALLRPRAG